MASTVRRYCDGRGPGDWGHALDDRSDQMTEFRVSATRRIAAPARRLYEIVSHPSGPVDVAGSAMLERAPDARPLTAVGQTFDMDMDRAPLNDVPGMGKYSVRNTVTQIVPNRLFEWGI